ncbi:hypothetical protein GCM10018781_70810 [Kitasatospora indigofera]|uniref:Uncharacterized protein n=1 Tax=Kitasatospora indigofera TaxID=67307 RepID=A0A919GG86_9ACTN|nr:hypothetical protein [Kitasatospora indigofera]GHH83489.1 hypothetical protein GCM10018781_70810 [Kitasatospora indigofera]
MLKFSGQPAVPKNVQTSLQSLVDNAHLLSPQLRDALTFVRTHESVHLLIEVLDTGTGAHGNTGTFVGLPGAPAGTLAEEAFLSGPALLLGRHDAAVKVTVAAGPGASPVEASTTLLHELELHAAPAALLLQRLARTPEGDDARLGLVLDRMRRADEHTDLDRQEQYVRSAARMHAAAAGSGTAEWAAALLRRAGQDATEQFAAYEAKSKDMDASSPARVEWLIALIARISQAGPDAVADRPKPGPRQARARAAVQGLDAAGLIASRLTERVGMLDVVDEARAAFGLPVGRLLDLYCRQLVPALLAHAPGHGLTDLVQQLVFLNHHGVPDLVALDALDAVGTTAPPTVAVTSSWPPAGMPVFWLSDGERGSWTQLTGLPEAVQRAGGIEHGSLLYLDGKVYRAAVSANRPAQEPQSTRFFPHPASGSYVALLKQ